MPTYTAKTGEIQHGWYVVDAQGKVLGRLAAQLAELRGARSSVRDEPAWIRDASF
jgi:large subunit ribosomal protein L13